MSITNEAMRLSDMEYVTGKFQDLFNLGKVCTRFILHAIVMQIYALRNFWHAQVISEELGKTYSTVYPCSG
jgi:hypothetical protein